MQFKLKGKFLLPTIILVIAGMAVTGYLSYYFAADAFTASVKNELEQKSRSTASLLATWLSERRREVKNWSRIKIYNDALKDGFLAKAARKTACTNMADLQKEYPFLESINLANKEGEVVSASDEKNIGTKITDRGYFKEAINGALNNSKVLSSKQTGNPVFVIASPVQGKDGVDGILFVVVDLQSFNRDFIDPVKIGETGFAFMLNQQGLVIAYPPDKTQVMKLNIAEYDFGQKMMADDSGLITFPLKGIQRISAFQKNKETGWTIGMVASTKEVYAPAYRIGYINLALTIVVTVIIALAILVIVGRVVTGPLGNVVGVIEKLSQGNLRERVNITSHDELGQLSASVDGFIKSLSDFTDLLQKIGQGDLTHDIPHLSDEDQIGPAAQAMLQNLRDIVGRVNQSSAQIANGSAQVSDSSQALSQGATEQAASLEEITSSMTELGGQTSTNAENASQANQLAKSARNAAEKGNQQMDEMVGAMKDIADSSKEIAKIIKAIDDIAFQTNLLALNAAVEAARAGKHGKGFAVVAQEVRNLAGRSAKAAQETAELIEGAVKKVESGTEIMNRTASALSEIMEGSTQVTDLVGEIAAASNEQAQGISQINQGLSQVEQVTQQNTASAEQTASASVELTEQARQLNLIISQFKLTEGSISDNYNAPIPDQITQGPTERAFAATPSQPKTVLPDEIISLDEDEFGKY